MTDVLARIAALSRLEDGWHYGEGRQPTAAALSAAEEFVREKPVWCSDARAFPTFDGGIQLAMNIGPWDVEIEMLPEGGVEVYAEALNDQMATFQQLGPDVYAALDAIAATATSP